MFINYSNHPSSQWDEKQKQAAEKYGVILDVPFPKVGEEYSKQEIQDLAKVEVEKLLQYQPKCILCQGEMTLTYQVVQLLKEHNVMVVSATSKRDVVEHNGVKVSKFKFCKLREY